MATASPRGNRAPMRGLRSTPTVKKLWPASGSLRSARRSVSFHSYHDPMRSMPRPNTHGSGMVSGSKTMEVPRRYSGELRPLPVV